MEQQAQDIRVRLTYRADGMIRPLTYTSIVAAKSVSDAVWFATQLIKSAYASGFKVESWVAENLSRPVTLTYTYRSDDAQGTAEGVCGNHHEA